jgi:fructose-bisphosphate aldolase class I
MSTTDLGKTAQALVADGRGILAADETVPTVTRRLAALMIESTPESRRAYREMFFTTPGIADFISGIIMQDETIHQKNDKETPLADLLIRQGIIPGIKVDNGAKPFVGSPGERITEGLHGLRDRLLDYGKLGARFAKWRAVIEVNDILPSAPCVLANAHALGRYAAVCQEQGMVPIVEAEVLMDGSHSIERCEEVTGNILHAVFDALVSRRYLSKACCSSPTWLSRAARVRGRPMSGRSRSPRCAVSAGMCRPQSVVSCSYRAAMISSSRPCI